MVVGYNLLMLHNNDGQNRKRSWAKHTETSLGTQDPKPAHSVQTPALSISFSPVGEFLQASNSTGIHCRQSNPKREHVPPT